MNNLFLNKNNLALNVKKMQTLADGKKICAVVKANAYGLGIKKVAKILNDFVDYFAVNSICEAKKIGHFNKKILVLLPTEKIEKSENIEYFVSSFENLQKLEKSAQKMQICACVHLKLNCGMNRLGMGEDELKKCLEFLKDTRHLKLVGVGTHFATSRGKFYQQQKKKFEFLIEKFGLKNMCVHTSSSHVVLNDKNFCGNMVRVGIALYGGADGFLPATYFCGKILQIHNLQKGDRISYGGKFTVKKQMQVATVSLGYYNGIFKNFFKKGFLILNEKKCKILGTICMNMLVVDVSKSKAKIGQKVFYLNEKQTVLDVAKICRVSPYEVLTNLKR